MADNGVTTSILYAYDHASQSELHNNDATADRRPTLHGEGEPDTNVSIYLNDRYVGEAHVNADGGWEYTMPDMPVGGPCEFRVWGEGEPGMSDPFDLIARGAVHSAVSIIRADAGDGYVGDGMTTGDTLPSISGAVDRLDIGWDDGDRWITIMDNGVEVAQVRADHNGQWVYQPESPLGAGEHNFTAMLTHYPESLGNSPVSESYRIDVAPVSAPAAASETIDLSARDHAVAENASAHDTTGLHAPASVDAIAPVMQALSYATDPRGEALHGGETVDYVNAVVLRGTGEPGSWITIMDGTHEVARVQVGVSGTWMNQPALNEGEHHLVAVSEQGVSSAAIDFTINVPLSISAIYDNIGTSQTTRHESGDTMTHSGQGLGGKAHPGSWVVLMDGDHELGRVQANSSGSWIFKLDVDLSPGEHHISAVSADGSEVSQAFDINYSPYPSALNTTESLSLSDASVPAITHVYDDAGHSHDVNIGDTTHNPYPTIQGTGEPNSLIDIWDGGDRLGTAQVDNDGHWSFTPQHPLDDGIHFFIAGSDAGASSMFTFFVGQSPAEATPTIGHVYSGADGSHELANMETTHDARVRLEGTAKAGSMVTIYDGYNPIGTTQADSHGHWTFDTPELRNGGHTLKVMADGQNSASFSIGVAVPPMPLLTIDHVYDSADGSHEVANQGVARDSHVRLEGTAKAGSLVTIYDGTTPLGTAQADSNGHWTFDTAELSRGLHNLHAGADGHQNAYFGFAVPGNLIPPPFINHVYDGANGSHEVPNLGATHDSHVRLEGTAKPGSEVRIFDDNHVIGTALADGNGNWTFDTPHLNSGGHTLQAFADGQASAKFAIGVISPITYVHDDAGAIQGDFASGYTTDDSHPTLHGTAEPNSMVTIYDRFVDAAGNGHQAAAIGTATVDAQGNWSFTPEAALGNGTHSFGLGTSPDNISPEFVLKVDAAPQTQGHADTLSLNDVLGTGESELFAADYSHDNAQLSVHDAAAPVVDNTALHGLIVATHDMASLNANLVLPHEQMHAHTVM